MTLSTPHVLLLLHAAVTAYMAGLCWFVQVVHYPLMAWIGEDRFEDYERRHTERTSLVTGPVMLVEFGLAGWLAMRPPAGVWPELTWAGAALLGVVWVSTFVVQVPCHMRLTRAYDAPTIERLVRTNWVRTIAWTARTAVALLMLAQFSGSGG